MPESYSKVRDRSLFALGKCDVTSTDRFGVSTTQHLSAQASFVQSDTFSGQKNPYWKSQIENLTSATTPASGVKYSHKGYTPVTAFRDVKSTDLFNTLQRIVEYSYGFPTYSYPSALSIPSSIQTEVDNRAIVKFLEKCQQSRSSILVGQDIGEIRETIHGLRHPFDSMRRLVVTHLRNFKKKLPAYKKRAKFLEKAVADSYLEFTYGWNPLVQDINDAVEGLRKIRKSSERIMSSATGIYSGVSDTGTSNLSFSTYTRLFFNSQVIGRYSVRYIGSVKTGAVNGSVPLKQEFRLDNRSFIPTIWELIPYSFIADYFVNIGDIITALCFRSADIAWVCKTSRQSTTRSYRVTGFGLKPGNFSSPMKLVSERYSGGNTDMSVTSFSRSIIRPQDLVPTLHFTVPISGKPWENLGFLTLARATNAQIADVFRKK